MSERENNVHLIITFILLTIKPTFNCIVFIFKAAGIALPLKMIYVYLLLLVCLSVIIYLYRPPLKNLICYLIILVFYGINYLLATPETKQYFNTDVAAILFVYAPIACICTTRIINWKPIFDDKRYLIFVDIVIVLSLLSKIKGINTVGYMSFSYSLLPLWGICLVAALAFGHRPQWVFLIIGGLEGLMYGARAPLLWIFILAVITWCVISIKNIKERKLPPVIPVLLFLTLLLVVMHYLIPALLDSSFLDTSYVLKRLSAGTFFISNPRKESFPICQKIISEMGLSVNGLFYDRTVLPDGQYAHNIVYEVLMSLGWIFGIPFLLAVFGLIVKAFYKQNYTGIVFVGYFICTLFLRYLLSGSIFDETNFVMFLATLYSMQASCSATTVKKAAV